MSLPYGEGLGGIVIFGFGKKKAEGKEQEAPKGVEFSLGGGKKTGIPSRIADCQKLIRGIFGNSDDIVIQSFDTVREKAMILFIDGLVNKDMIDRDIIRPLKSVEFDGNVSLALKTVYKEAEDIDTCVADVLTGVVAIFYEGGKIIYLMELRGWSQRAVETPAAETVIRGPQEGFTENIRTNSAMIRRKIKTPKLIMENVVLGKQSRTTVELVYLEGIVNRDVLQEVRNRIDNLDVDLVLETGHIEQHLDKHTFSPISGIGLTQKPDKLAQKIAEGRVAILCDGTPHALLIPELFIENLQTGEDYYNRTLYANIIRLLRFAGLAITVFLPGFAAAILTYNQEMLPSVFLTSIINSSLKTPMPISAELVVLILMFELLKEAGTRLPHAVGSAITIVGSLIIGEAAVNAGIVSEPSVIVIALTAVTSFTAPNLTEFTLVYRLFFWLLGSTLGLIGLGAGLVVMLTQLISQESFGIPILSSFSPQEMKDSLVRFPLDSLKYRPQTIAKDNVRRRGEP